MQTHFKLTLQTIFFHPLSQLFLENRLPLISSLVGGVSITFTVFFIDDSILCRKGGIETYY